MTVTAARSSGVSSADLLCRIRAEYREMPGLRLTASQARCLFGLDDATCQALLAALLDAKFLACDPHGLFSMISSD